MNHAKRQKTERISIDLVGWRMHCMVFQFVELKELFGLRRMCKSWHQSMDLHDIDVRRQWLPFEREFELVDDYTFLHRLVRNCPRTELSERITRPGSTWSVQEPFDSIKFAEWVVSAADDDHEDMKEAKPISDWLWDTLLEDNMEQFRKLYADTKSPFVWYVSVSPPDIHQNETPPTELLFPIVLASHYADPTPAQLEMARQQAVHMKETLLSYPLNKGGLRIQGGQVQIGCIVRACISVDKFARERNWFTVNGTLETEDLVKLLQHKRGIEVWGFDDALIRPSDCRRTIPIVPIASIQ